MTVRDDVRDIKLRLKKVENQLEKEEERVFVPKEIGITEISRALYSFGLVNPLTQVLYKDSREQSFDADSGSESDNTGKNYVLKRVDKPEPNKLYYVNDSNDFREINDIGRYVIFLDDDTYCWWHEIYGFYSVLLNQYDFSYYYEVIKID